MTQLDWRETFQQTVLDFYRAKGRHGMPWRSVTEPYVIVVSELMLQQTQASRVLPKFRQFMARFPNFESLAAAPLADVLAIWLGLGYNRRARFLHTLAQQVVERFDGKLPADQKLLESLPGVGPNTAGAILAYAFNRPVVFVETNIRTVYIHHFFHDRNDVSDAEVKMLLAETLDKANPRRWYWASMDYGAHIKATAGNNIHRSRHYVKQSRFQGSFRQLRGAILRQLHTSTASLAELSATLPDERLTQAIEMLKSEGFIEENKSVFRLTGASKLP